MTSTQVRTGRAGLFWWDSLRPGDHATQSLRAMVFDLDALADVECDGHRVAFNTAFEAHGLALRWSVPRYRNLLALSDERQRVAAELRARGICTECDTLAKVLVDEICVTKSMVVAETMLAADLVARVGVVDLISDAFTAGVPVVIIGGGCRQWVEPLVRQLVGDGLVQAIVTNDDVASPGRDAYRHALADLGVTAREVLAFTGSPGGLRSATATGIAGVLVDPAVAGARQNYDGLLVTDCRRLLDVVWTGGKGSAAA